MEPNASGSTVKKQEDPPEDSKPPKQDVKPVVKTLNRVPSMSLITLPAEDSLICPLLDLSRGLCKSICAALIRDATLIRALSVRMRVGNRKCDARGPTIPPVVGAATLD